MWKTKLTRCWNYVFNALFGVENGPGRLETLFPKFNAVSIVPSPQSCSFCFGPIGATRRGMWKIKPEARAFFCPESGEWECLRCAPERIRWETVVRDRTKKSLDPMTA